MRLEQRELNEQNEKTTKQQQQKELYTCMCAAREETNKQTLNLLYNSQKLNKNSIGFYSVQYTHTEMHAYTRTHKHTARTAHQWSLRRQKIKFIECPHACIMYMRMTLLPMIFFFPFFLCLSRHRVFWGIVVVCCCCFG